MPGDADRPWDVVEPAEAEPAGTPAPETLPLVFVHGTRLTRAVWWPQLERLAPARRCVAVDLPGHGLRAGEAFSLPGAVAALGRAIDEAAGGRAIVVGLSLGGYVAIELAASTPGRVAGLVLAGTTREPAGRAGLPYRLLATAFERLPARLIDGLNDRLFTFRYGPAVSRRIATAGYWPHAGAAALRALVDRRFAPRLAAYDGPVLVLNGQYDLLFRLGEPAFLAAAPQARRLRLPRAAHLSNLDAPAAFSRTVARFADTLVGEPVTRPRIAPGNPRDGAGSAGEGRSPNGPVLD